MIHRRQPNPRRCFPRKPSICSLLFSTNGVGATDLMIDLHPANGVLRFLADVIHKWLVYPGRGHCQCIFGCMLWKKRVGCGLDILSNAIDDKNLPVLMLVMHYHL
jgi:hypothetical protein